MLTAFELGGHGALYYASAELKADREVVLAAMQHDDDALRFASGHLRFGDEGTALEAEAAKLRVNAAQLRAGGRLALALQRVALAALVNSPSFPATDAFDERALALQAAGDTANLPHPLSTLAGVLIRQRRGCQRADSVHAQALRSVVAMPQLAVIKRACAQGWQWRDVQLAAAARTAAAEQVAKAAALVAKQRSDAQARRAEVEGHLAWGRALSAQIASVGSMSEDEQDEGTRRTSRLQTIEAAAGCADTDTTVPLLEALGLYRELELVEADSSDSEGFEYDYS